MKMLDIARRSSRSLKSAKLRTLLTALAIAVGGFTLTLTFAASNGARDYANKLINSNFDPSELIVGKDAQLFSNSTTTKPQEYDPSIASFSRGGGGAGANVQLRRMTAEDVTKLRANPHISQVREAYTVAIQYVTRAGQKRYTGSIGAYNSAQRPEAAAGTLPGQGDIADNDLVLPDTYLDVLHFKTAAAAIGQTVSINVQQPFSQSSLQALLGQIQAGQATATSVGQNPAFATKTVDFTVRAVTKKAATSLDFGLPSLLVSNAQAKALNEYTTQGTADFQKFLFVYARVKNGDNKATRDTVAAQLKHQGYVVQSVEDTQKTLTQIVTILQAIVSVFGAITVVASVFGVVNTQYISVLERTREIGLMKALGMSRGTVSRLFILEATWLGFIGGLIGALLGVALGTALNPFISRKLSLGPGSNLIVFQPLQIVLLILGLMLVTTLAGLLPARKAARLDPIEALRTE